MNKILGNSQLRERIKYLPASLIAAMGLGDLSFEQRYKTGCAVDRPNF